ncbi:MAG: site-2 protease family protein [Planctomycetota bacterium]
MRLALRLDLRVSPRIEGGESYYVIDDPLHGRYYRLGTAEYAFVSLLDGRTTLRDALAKLSSAAPGHQLSENEAAGLCRWLARQDLAQTAESSRSERLSARAEKDERRQWLARINPLSFRIPLLSNPDRAINAAQRLVGSVFSPAASGVWIGLVIVGCYRLQANWEQFASSLRGFLAPDNWLWIGVCWLLLKLLHELAHGIACQRYGGAVREAGVMFVMLAPLAYVDVTSSWRFPDRWQRIVVAAAGMYAEIAVAAIAAIVWSETESPWTKFLCANLVAMASLATIVFNANPLMKFDGYYILSDWLGIPNLYPNGEQYLKTWARRHLFGVSVALPEWPQRQRRIIQCYAWASLAWRVATCAALIASAAALFHGAGIAMSGFAVFAWAIHPLFRLGGYLFGRDSHDRPKLWRFAAIVGPTSVVVAGVLLGVPWPGLRTAPAVVEYSPQTIVRASTAGFVRAVEARDGQTVRRGQTLAVLENRGLAREREELDGKIQQASIRALRCRQTGEHAAAQAEDRQRAALESQRNELLDQLDQLVVRAPRSGRFTRRGFDFLIDTFLEQGAEIGVIGDERRKEIRLSLSEDDYEAFARRGGAPVLVNVPRQPLWRDSIDVIQPRATLQPPHPALIASNGGPLAVKAEPPESSRDGRHAPSEPTLLAPRFLGRIRLDSAISERLFAGQTAEIGFRPCDRSIGEQLFFSFSEWLRERMRPEGARN